MQATTRRVRAARDQAAKQHFCAGQIVRQFVEREERDELGEPSVSSQKSGAFVIQIPQEIHTRGAPLEARGSGGRTHPNSASNPSTHVTAEGPAVRSGSAFLAWEQCSVSHHA